MTEITLLNKGELESNPKIIGENLRQLAVALQETKGDLESIKGRSFWKKITSNNTRDLAEAMLRQNDSISAFLVIVQSIVFLSMNNTVVLGGVMETLSKVEETNETRDNQYIALAKDYLGEALKSAKRISDNERRTKQLFCWSIVVGIISIIALALSLVVLLLR